MYYLLQVHCFSKTMVLNGTGKPKSTSCKKIDYGTWQRRTPCRSAPQSRQKIHKACGSGMCVQSSISPQTISQKSNDLSPLLTTQLFQKLPIESPHSKAINMIPTIHRVEYKNNVQKIFDFYDNVNPKSRSHSIFMNS